MKPSLLIGLIGLLPTLSFAEMEHGIDGAPLPWTHEQFDNDPDKFTFAVFADLTGGERPGVFATAVNQLNLLRPELIVNVGDLIEGDGKDPTRLHDQWDSFDARADRARAPIFYAGGNHDLTGEPLRGIWRERLGPPYYHFVYRDVLFLMLDTEDNTPERMVEIDRIRAEGVEVYKTKGPEAFKSTAYANLPERVSGCISAAQSAYFQEIIAEHPEVRWTFVMLHKPAWGREDEEHFAAIESALSERPYTVFYGHTHIYQYLERHGRDYINVSITGGQAFHHEGRSMDHVTLVTVDDTDEVTVANLMLGGILDKTGQVPFAEGEPVEFVVPEN